MSLGRRGTLRKARGSGIVPGGEYVVSSACGRAIARIVITRSCASLACRCAPDQGYVPINHRRAPCTEQKQRVRGGNSEAECTAAWMLGNSGQAPRPPSGRNRTFRPLATQQHAAARTAIFASFKEPAAIAAAIGETCQDYSTPPSPAICSPALRSCRPARCRRCA